MHMHTQERRSLMNGLYTFCYKTEASKIALKLLHYKAICNQCCIPVQHMHTHVKESIIECTYVYTSHILLQNRGFKMVLRYCTVHLETSTLHVIQNSTTMTYTCKREHHWMEFTPSVRKQRLQNGLPWDSECYRLTLLKVGNASSIRLPFLRWQTCLKESCIQCTQKPITTRIHSPYTYPIRVTSLLFVKTRTHTTHKALHFYSSI